MRQFFDIRKSSPVSILSFILINFANCKFLVFLVIGCNYSSCGNFLTFIKGIGFQTFGLIYYIVFSAIFENFQVFFAICSVFFSIYLTFFHSKAKNSDIHFGTTVIKFKVEECQIAYYGNMNNDAGNLN